VDSPLVPVADRRLTLREAKGQKMTLNSVDPGRRVIARLMVLLFGLIASGITGAADAPLPGGAASTATSTSAAGSGPTAAGSGFKSLDGEVQGLKKEVLDLNRDLYLLEEELLFPANTQVAVFVSLDVGTFFELDSIQLKLDNKEVANYLYTDREVEALNRGGVHRLFIGNLKTGKHELVAFFTGKGPHERDYKRGANLNFEKGVGAKYLELKISDRQSAQQPEFAVKEWE
jgi:hypothetical protein